MVSKIAPSLPAFTNTLKKFEHACQKDILDNNCIASKSLLPFQKDLPSSVPIDFFLSSVFVYCRENKCYLSQSLVNRVNLHILKVIGDKTSKKYTTELEAISSELEDLALPVFNKKYIWPKDLKKISLTQKGKERLESIFREALPLISEPKYSYTLTKKKGVGNKKSIRKFTIIENGVPFKEYTLPITIAFVRKESFSHIVLMGKKILGSGGERANVRLCYNLTEGSYLARKIITTPMEKALFKYLEKNPQEGIIPVFGMRTSLDQPNKEQALEYRQTNTLIEFMKSSLSLDVKFSIIRDLLSGLANLHNRTLSNIHYEGYTVPLLNGFHHDIKPANILINTSGKTSAYLADFGSACNPLWFGGTAGWRAPELLKKLSSCPTTKEFIDYNLKYGQRSDLWSMGLVFVTLLAGYSSTTSSYDDGDAPIACIETHLQPDLDDDSSIADIKQADLDRDLTTLKVKSLQPLKESNTIPLKRIWDELVFKMLRVDPKERPTARDALSIFNAIMVT